MMKQAGRSFFLRYFVPGAVIGILIAAGAVFTYHKSGDARFCGACHSMESVHAKWQASIHHQFACTECHQPDIHITGKVVYKTQAGLNDLYHETLRDYPAEILLSKKARAIVVKNCIRCHASTIADTKMLQDGGDCLKCHRYLVHGRGSDEGGIYVEK